MFKVIHTKAGDNNSKSHNKLTKLQHRLLQQWEHHVLINQNQTHGASLFNLAKTVAKTLSRQLLQV
jgi:hypothetical protein